MTVAAESYQQMILGTVHDYGDRALLLDFDDISEVLAWTAAIHHADLPGVLDVVPGARTVLVTLAGPRHQAPTRQRLAPLQPDRPDAAADSADRQADVVIEVV